MTADGFSGSAASDKLYTTRQYMLKEIEELAGVKKATVYRELHKLKSEDSRLKRQEVISRL